MEKMICKIGCKSQQDNIKKMLGSIIRVYAGLSVSKLQLDWQFTSDSDVSWDVHIIDLDDENYPQYIVEAQQAKAVVMISSSAHILRDYEYTLTKPIMNHQLLTVLKLLEKEKIIISEEKMTEVAVFPQSEIISAMSRSEEVVTTKASEYEQTKYQLVAWPDLTQVPKELLLNTSRVCALLATQPRSLTDIAQLLNISLPELGTILSTIQNNAYTFLTTLHKIEQSIENHGLISSFSNEVPNSSFLTKIWNRLKGAF